LRQAGVEDLRIIEKGCDFGGTWYWNRYPGARCDVESYIYLPLLEEVGYIPTEKYVGATETLEYSKMFGRHFDLYRAALFQTTVSEARWDESISRWVVTTNRGDSIRARFLTMANGPLHKPKLPGIPGMHDFKGHIFHTSRWDYEYTGGSSDGGLEKLRDKKVAVIGTGCTGIQVVPNVAPYAEQLYVFQRTPSSVAIRGNTPTDPEWSQNLQPGWQKKRMENFNYLVNGQPLEENLVQDEWTRLFEPTLKRLVASGIDPSQSDELARIMELGDFDKMEEFRNRIGNSVDDADTAEALKPYYQLFCKRPAFSDQYLPVFNQPNVTLISDAQGVEKITENGLVAGGTEYEVDLIVLATGFETVANSHYRRTGYHVIGRDGKKLVEHWENNFRTMHSCASYGFPNCFFLMAEQGGFTVNFPHMLDEMSAHVAHIIQHAIEIKAATVEVTDEGEKGWLNTLSGSKTGTGMISGPECTPGYYNNEGQRNPHAAQGSPYGGYAGPGSWEFFKLIKNWRESGDYEGLEFTE
jgi:cyclohexanone monooxygenase